MIYRPSCRVRLQLRLDEANDVELLRAGIERGDAFSTPGLASTAGATDALAKNAAARAQLQQQRVVLPKPVLEAELARLDLERAKIQRKAFGGAEGQRPENLEKKPPDNRTLDLDILPEQCNISRSNLKDCSTVDMTMKWRDLPIDPRVVRSALIISVIGAVSADDWEAGISGQSRRSDGSPLSVINRDPGQELRFTSTSRFVGFVDEWTTEFSDDGDTIVLTGRDVSALMRDQQLEVEHGIDLDLPIAKGVEELLSRFPMTRGLKVVYGLPRDPNDPLNQISEEPLGPVPAASSEKNGPIPGSGKLGKGKGKRQGFTKKSDERESVWDHITKVLQRLALVPVMRGFTLYLLEPRTLFADPTRRRKMVWGKNLKGLSFSRKMGGVKCQTIEVRSPNPEIGRTLWARYPVFQGQPASGVLGQGGSPQPTKTRQVVVGPTGAADEAVLVQYVRGVRDQKVLENIARNVFEEIGRQEVEGSFSTDDVDSFESLVEADLLDLQPGDPVEVLVAKPTKLEQSNSDTGIASINPFASDPPVNSLSNELQRLNALSIAERSAYLEGLGFSSKAARRLAEAQEQARLTSIFRIGHVNLKFDREDGIEVEADFHNYIYVREDPPAEQSPRLAPTTLSGAAAAASAASK